MIETRQAIVLAAGEGKRLYPLTESTPKCLIEVAGHRILDNTLEALAVRGVRTVRIVIGHLAGQIRDVITNHYLGMSIRYILNPIYHHTNSMYSLFLALEELNESTWMFEGDVFFEHSILDLPTPGDIAWLVDSTNRGLDGAYLGVDTNGRACSLEIVRDVRRLQSNQFKSASILHISTNGVQQIRTYLEQGIKEGKQNTYYDLILGNHLKDIDVRAMDVVGKKWFEVDTLGDLKKARALFA